MTIKILVVGKTRDAHLHSLQNLFLERLRKYVRVDIAVIPEKKAGRKSSAQALAIEGRRISNELSEKDFVVILDSRGQLLSSAQLASLMEKQMVGSTRNVAFVIGGPDGLDEEVRAKADLLLSFSKMTFTHEMTRVLLLEQLYRAFTLIRGEKYHR